MSTLAAAASNLDDPPPKINKPPSASPSLFDSLPNDVVFNVLARVPKSCYPILSCVSKKFQSLLRSPEIHKFRSHLNKDSLYICFVDGYANTRNWFTLRRIEKNPTENLFVSVDFPNLDNYSSVVPVGPEIFFIGGGSDGAPSSSFWIFDSRSGKYRQGPSMQVERKYTSVGLVGGKVYVIGADGLDNILAESFDLKTQIWKPAPIPEEKGPYTWQCAANVALDRKVCALESTRITCYDTKDGSCESFEFANKQWCSTRVCVIDNVFYVYYSGLGLMWYDSKLKQWRLVDGLDHLNKNPPVGIAEYYGKLAYMWIDWDRVVDGSETKEIWCRMIALDKSEVGGREIHGTAEPSQLLGIVPRRYALQKCLSLSG